MSDSKHLVLPFVFEVAIVTLCYFFLGLIPAIIFLIAFGSGLTLYVRTAWWTQFDRLKVIEPYLLTILFFLIHTYKSTSQVLT
jgi:hypothetical protein